MESSFREERKPGGGEGHQRRRKEEMPETQWSGGECCKGEGMLVWGSLMGWAQGQQLLVGETGVWMWRGRRGRDGWQRGQEGWRGQQLWSSPSCMSKPQNQSSGGLGKSCTKIIEKWGMTKVQGPHNQTIQYWKLDILGRRRERGLQVSTEEQEDNGASSRPRRDKGPSLWKVLERQHPQ